MALGSHAQLGMRVVHTKKSLWGWMDHPTPRLPNSKSRSLTLKIAEHRFILVETHLPRPMVGVYVRGMV